MGTGSLLEVGDKQFDNYPPMIYMYLSLIFLFPIIIIIIVIISLCFDQALRSWNHICLWPVVTNHKPTGRRSPHLVLTKHKKYSFSAKTNILKLIKKYFFIFNICKYFPTSSAKPREKWCSGTQTNWELLQLLWWHSSKIKRIDFEFV